MMCVLMMRCQAAMAAHFFTVTAKRLYKPFFGRLSNKIQKDMVLRDASRGAFPHDVGNHERQEVLYGDGTKKSFDF